MTMEETTFDVIVLGAGLSGLYAARELLRRSHAAANAANTAAPQPPRVAVLEARDRVGGRTHSITFHGDAYDLGGQWVGPTQHLTLDLVRELQIQPKRQPWFAAPPAAAAAAATSSSPTAAVSPSADTETAAAAAAAASFNSGCAVPLSAAEAAEAAAVTSELDAMALSPAAAPGPPWSRQAREWDAVDCGAWLAGRCRQSGARRELLLFVQTVLAADPQQVSLLFLLQYGELGLLAR
jgi:monoamine oxidase